MLQSDIPVQNATFVAPGASYDPRRAFPKWVFLDAISSNVVKWRVIRDNKIR